jgi:hypothetical protein
MLKRFVARSFCAASVLAALTSCGDAKSGGTGEFTTVFATVTGPAGFDSDVATWVDATTGSPVPVACAANAVRTVKPDDMNYTFTSTAYASPSTGSSNPTVPSDLLIQSATLTFIPANTNSPALPPLYQSQPVSAGQRVVAGSATTIPVRVASNSLKSFFLNQLGSQSLDCTNQGVTYSYYATVTFNAVEVSTNRTATISPAGAVLVNFSDFIDGSK